MIRLLAVLMLLVACSNPSAEAETVSTNKPEPKSEKATVTFHTARGDVMVTSEVARTGQARRQGLMHRRELAAHHGMIFIFETEEPQRFWMKNTYLFLDMIFINDAHEVVGIVERAEPENLTPRGVAAPSRYVVEVIGGYARQYGIEEGVRVSFSPLGTALP